MATLGVDQCHWPLAAKMKVTEEFHSTRCVDFAEWNWVGKGIDEVAAVKEGVDVTRVVSGSCFVQRGRMYPKKTNWLSPAGFGRAPSCLNSVSGGVGVATVGREVIEPVVDDTVWTKRHPRSLRIIFHLYKSSTSDRTRFRSRCRDKTVLALMLPTPRHVTRTPPCFSVH